MKKNGRPKKEINKDELDKLLRLSMSLKETANWFDCSEMTMLRFIKKEYGEGFDTLRDKRFVYTKAAIKRCQIEKALKSDNTMLIWCGKQYLGQSDKNQLQVEDVTIRDKAEALAKLQEAMDRIKEEIAEEL